jgi:hypothetical protein
MTISSSTSSSSRVHSDGERGFALLSAIVIAVLFFVLIQLLLVEATSASRQAVRFGARITSQVLAENAAELAALQMVRLGPMGLQEQLDGASIQATWQRFPEQNAGEVPYLIRASASVEGVQPVEARVEVYGRLGATWITVDRTEHSQ